MPEAATQIHTLSAHGLILDIDGKRLIDDINLELQPGGTSTILGYNGAGKSLLLRLLHGLIQPTKGDVLCNGEHLSRSYRKKQAMVFQKPVLLRRSVIENVRFALRVRQKDDKHRAAQMLQAVGLEKQASQAARLLSGGEQQRLAMARALANDPDVLFLDEVTANLDPASVGWIEHRIQEITAGGTKVVMVTHDLAMARRLSDEIVFLDRGRLLAQAPASNFFSQTFNQESDKESHIVESFMNGRLPVPFRNKNMS